MLDRLRAPGTVLLDAPRRDVDTGRTGAWLFDAPHDVLIARRAAEVRGVLDAVDRSLANGQHVAGMLSYEAGYALEPDRFPHPPESDLPLVWFGIYDAPEAVHDLPQVLAALTPPVVTDPTFAWSESDYAARVAAVHAHIRAGDVYQINLTLPVTFGLEGDPLALFAALRARQPVSYGAWIVLPEAAIVSVSPELFVRVDRDPAGRIATARPMKGTTARGASQVEDDALVRALVASEKDRAENLMIVDLLRNDLSRVAEAGSVRVPSLFDTERYDTLTQMTSTVQARLPPDATLGGLLRATFPCGSITGAPKLRAMEVIRALEDRPRGVYCGAIGHAAPDGTASFSVAIRTAVVQQGRGIYGVGSGIVWDSQADTEWAECHLKARILTCLAS